MFTPHRSQEIQQHTTSLIVADGIAAADVAGGIDRLTARANSLFASDLSALCDHSRAEITAAIERGIRSHGGILGCVGEVAAAYGEHPETAAARMRWARSVIEYTYSPEGRKPGTSARSSGRRCA